jgi:integrase
MIFTYQSDRMHDSWVLPITDTMKRSTKGKRKRKLDDAELKAVWTEAKSEASGEFGRFLRFLFLVPCRRSKVLAMRFDEVRNGVWYIPRKDREKGVPNYIRLPNLALDLFNEQRRLINGDRVWPGCAALSRHKRQFDARCPLPQWQLHDARRCVRSRMGKLKDAEDRTAVLPFVCEAVLGHTLKITDVQDVYDQADYSDEVSDALALYEQHVMSVVGENIHQLPIKKKDVA